MYKCKTCGVEGQENFYSHKYKCKKCWNQYTYQRNIQKFVDYLTEFRQGIKCERCGYDKGFWGLAFHHRDSSQKEFGLDRNRGKNKEVLYKELDKCDVLCHNCHAEVHYEMRNSGL
jgi:DNA-directed RNA polymerase subunit RPC12/RpoP